LFVSRRSKPYSEAQTQPVSACNDRAGKDD
jgi:hypothetical protein